MLSCDLLYFEEIIMSKYIPNKTKFPYKQYWHFYIRIKFYILEKQWYFEKYTFFKIKNILLLPSFFERNRKIIPPFCYFSHHLTFFFSKIILYFHLINNPSLCSVPFMSKFYPNIKRKVLAIQRTLFLVKFLQHSILLVEIHRAHYFGIKTHQIKKDTHLF